jgi:glucose-6-phosphate 1-epimerase
MKASATLIKGINNLPKVVLISKDGAHAEIYLHGAHLTSWTPAGGEERLFLSRASQFRPGTAIRGGVPVIFPQFAGRGPLPKHGFVRTSEWELVETDIDSTATSATFRLTDSEVTRQIWPHAFSALLTAAIQARQIELSLEISNPGSSVFSFTAALHTYLGTADISATTIEGLGKLAYLDSTASDCLADQAEADLSFNSEVDRIYLDTLSPLVVHLPGGSMTIVSRGFPDTVIWNPWREKGEALTDLEPEGYRHFVCLEAAVIGSPATLQPGESWRGVQGLKA